MTDTPFPASREAMLRVKEDPYRLGHKAHEPKEPVPGAGHGGTGPASKRIIVGYGFWLFLLSDIVMFACFFATYAVLQNATAGGPSIRSLVDLPRVGIETGALLLSSFTCGLSYAATNVRNKLWTQVFLALTGLLGLTRYAAEGDNEIRFVVSAGGGVKLRPTRNVGLRLDGRVFTTFADVDGRAIACSPGACFFAFHADIVWQAEFTAGLIVKMR